MAKFRVRVQPGEYKDPRNKTGWSSTGPYYETILEARSFVDASQIAQMQYFPNKAQVIQQI